jgi:hypothetical protein
VNLFTARNAKVGDALVFNLPVFKTCPGSTLFCESYCYGDWGGNRWPSARDKHAANYEATLRPDFVDRAVAELQDSPLWRRVLPPPTREEIEDGRAAQRPARKALLVRVHSVGDFYGAEYIRKWVEIASAAPEWTFWAYTRSWRVPDLVPDLERLAALPNFCLWLSADFMTKLPPPAVVPGRRGVAWMQAIGENLDWIADQDDGVQVRQLIFPVKAEARQPVKRVGLAMVCPHYNGTPEDKVQTCEECGFCFTASRHPLP